MKQPPRTRSRIRSFFNLALLCLILLSVTGCVQTEHFLYKGSLAKPSTIKKNTSLHADQTAALTKDGLTAKNQTAPAAKAESQPPAPASASTARPTNTSPVHVSSQAFSHQEWKRLPSKRQPTKDSLPIKVELTFDNADLYEVLDSTLYELYHIEYMIDPSIKAKVTFHLSGSYTRDQFINLINNILQLSNLAIVRGPGHFYKIVRRNLSAAEGIQQASRGSVTSCVGDVTRLIKLRYLSAATAMANIRPFLSRGATVVQSTVTNDLIITDTPENIIKAASILSLLDEPYYKDISWRVFPVREVDAQELSVDLSKIVKSNGLYNRPGINPGNVEILPIKTMNALLVISRWPDMIDTVGQWLEALDHAQDEGSNVFVYFVENGTAKDLADILKQLFGGKVSEVSNRTTIVKSTNKSKQPTSTTRVVTGELSGKVDIIPDEINNAIVFKATPRDYRIIHNVLSQLDIVPRQVLINVMIAEISLTGKVEYGIEWFLKGEAKNDYSIQGALDNGVGRPIDTPLGTATGFTLGVYDGVDFLRGLIHALGTDSGLNILSSPNILAVDNQEASIEVGEEIPTVTGQITDATSGSTVTNTIQYRKTGILLTVTPHINSNGLVKMKLSQEVSDKGEYDNALHTYSILNRKAVTSLVVNDGQTIVLGGIMRSKQNSSGAGIPFLKDIPGLGLLFGSTTKEVKKTELILLLTPHVITNREDIDLITKDFSRKVKQVMEASEAEKKN
ncbi:MAG: type II secretion system protein GspD [Desulfobacca sp. 4484_104]|nr:MAG: type II secretion system protein GspD [Desulfobacca sp. 4484_104]